MVNTPPDRQFAESASQDISNWEMYYDGYSYYYDSEYIYIYIYICTNSASE
jgi:hypothetical protein